MGTSDRHGAGVRARRLTVALLAGAVAVLGLWAGWSYVVDRFGPDRGLDIETVEAANTGIVVDVYCDTSRHALERPTLDGNDVEVYLVASGPELGCPLPLLVSFDETVEIDEVYVFGPSEDWLFDCTDAASQDGRCVEVELERNRER